MGQSVSVISGTALFLLRRVPGYRNMSAPNQKLVAMLCTVRHCFSFAPHCQCLTLIPTAADCCSCTMHSCGLPLSLWALFVLSPLMELTLSEMACT